MSTLGAGRTDNSAEKVEVCNTCGDVGFDDCLAVCSHCNEGAEHVYCMVTVFDTVPDDWVCEGCKMKQSENSGKRRLACNEIKLSQAHKKQALSNNFSAESLGLSHSSELFPEHFLKMQADKASSKASKEPAYHGAMIEGTSWPEPEQPTQKLGSSNANERYSVYMVEPDVNKPSCPVILAKRISTQVSSCSETDRSIFTGTDRSDSTSQHHNDKKNTAPKDLLVVSPRRLTETVSTPSMPQSVTADARVAKEPACLTGPLESVSTKDSSTVSEDMNICGEKIVSEEQELNTTVLTSLAKGEQLVFEAESHNLNETVAFSFSSLSKPVALVAKRNSVNATDKIPKCTDVVIRRSISNSQHSTIDSAFVNSESIKVASKSTTGNMVTASRMTPIQTTSKAERGHSSVDEDIPKHVDISVEKPNFKPVHFILNSASLKSESMKSASRPAIGKVVSACKTAPLPTTPLPERNSVCEDVPNHTAISLERPISKLQHAIVNCTSMKTESGGFVKKSKPHAAMRDFPIITQKITILGEKVEKNPNVKPKDKLPARAVLSSSVEGLSCPLIPGVNILVQEEIASGQEIIGSGNKLCAKEAVNIFGGLNKSFNLLWEEEEEHYQSGGIFIPGTTTEQETVVSHNGLKTQEEENALSGSEEPPSLFFEEEEAKPLKVKQKVGVAGSLSRLVSGLAECPSLFSKERKTQPQDFKGKGGMPGSLFCLMSGSVEPSNLFCEEEKAQPLDVKQKGEVAGSPCCLINASGTSSSRKAPTLSAPPTEKDVECLISSPCMMKEPSCDVVPRQEVSMGVASSARMDKICGTRLKQVAKRDLPPLKVRSGKKQKVMGHSQKETISSMIVTPLECREKVTGSRSDAVTRNFSDISLKVLPVNLKNSLNSTSMGNHAHVITPIEDDKRLSCSLLPVVRVTTKHTVSNGIDIKSASNRLEVEEEVIGNKESDIFPVHSHDIRSEVKGCLSNAKQECDNNVLASCLTKELPTTSFSTVIREEVAASKRKISKNVFSSWAMEDLSNTRVGTLEHVKGPCLPGQTEAITVNDTSTIELENKKAFGRGPLSRSGGLNNSLEGENADAVGRHFIQMQEGEALEAVAAASCQMRSSGDVIWTRGIATRDVSDAYSDKVTLTGEQVPLGEADHDFGDENNSDKVNVSPGRHTLRSPRASNRSASMTDGGNQLSFIEPTLRDSSDWKKEAGLSSVGSIRDGHQNATNNVARHADADHERVDRMGLWKSTSVRPTHHGLPGRDVELRSRKHDRYSRDSKRVARDLGSFKESYRLRRCHRCDEVGHSSKFCKAERQREHRTMYSPDFGDTDLPERRSNSGHIKRVNTQFQNSGGRKPWRFEPGRKRRFMNSSRSPIKSNSIGRVHLHFKGPTKVSKHTRYDEEREYKLHVREKPRFRRFDEEHSSKWRMRKEASFQRFDQEKRYMLHMREERSFERESPRLEITQSLNGMKSEFKPLLNQPEYIRIHKRQIVRVQTQDSCKPDTMAWGPPEQPPSILTNFENSAQGNAYSFPAGPAGDLRCGYSSRLLPDQVPLTPQDQFCKDRTLQTCAASRLQGSSIKNFPQERRAAPDCQVMWTGCFNVFSQASRATCYQGIQACPSNVANSKVLEALLALPSQLELEETKRGVETDSWPRAFQESPPTSHSIGVYFFAVDMESSSKWYKQLLHRLAACDLVLKVKWEFMQLLIFPSQLLPEAEQCWEDEYFFWGIFKNNKVVEDSSHLLRRDLGSELGSTGNGEVIDMDIDMVGGKDVDAVFGVWEEFDPPMPPGFTPECRKTRI